MPLFKYLEQLYYAIRYIYNLFSLFSLSICTNENNGLDAVRPNDCNSRVHTFRAVTFNFVSSDWLTSFRQYKAQCHGNQCSQNRCVCLSNTYLQYNAKIMKQIRNKKFFVSICYKIIPKYAQVHDFEVAIYLIYYCISVDFKTSVILTSWRRAT